MAFRELEKQVQVLQIMMADENRDERPLLNANGEVLTMDANGNGKRGVPVPLKFESLPVPYGYSGARRYTTMVVS